MSSQAEDDFIVSAYRLSKLAPQQWAEFLTAHREYVASMCEQAVRSSVADAQTAHGRAQAHLDMRSTFATLEATYIKIAKARQSTK